MLSNWILFISFLISPLLIPCIVCYQVLKADNGLKLYRAMQVRVYVCGVCACVSSSTQT